MLARRVVPLKERLQKALVMLVLTAAAVAGVFVLTGVTPLKFPRDFIAPGAIFLVGVSLSAYFWLKKEETAKTKQDGISVRRRIADDRQGRSWTGRLGYNAKRSLAGIVVLIGLLVALAGLVVLGLQIFGYLKTGNWQPVSTLGVMSPYWPWLDQPRTWFGLHKIIRDMLALMPFSIALVALGWLIAGFGSALRQRVALKY